MNVHLLIFFEIYPIMFCICTVDVIGNVERMIVVYLLVASNFFRSGYFASSGKIDTGAILPDLGSLNISNF